MDSTEIERLRREVARLEQRVTELETVVDQHAVEALHSLLSAMPAFVARVDPDLRLRSTNRLLPDLTLEDVIGKSIFDFVVDDDHEVARKAFAHTQATGEGTRYEVVGTGPNGEPAFYQTYVSPVREADGRIGFFLIAFDISDVVRKERALRESEDKLRFALEATKLGLWSWDLATDEVLWDERMKQLMGTEAAVAVMDYTDVLVHPEDRDAVRSAAERTFLLGRFESVPHRVVRPDGSVRWMLTLGEIVTDPEGKPIRLMGGNLDITEQRLLEEQLRRAQKMEAVGNLTAGVAHNFNNMLMAVLPSLELLREVVPQSHLDLLDDASGAAARAAEMVRKLMTFAGQRQPEAHPSCDVGTLAERVVRMCQRTFDRHIDLTCTVEPGTPRVAASAPEMEQVLINILLNARDAVLEAKNESPRVEVSVGPADGDLVSLRVRDNGVGMSDAAKHHVFEPFFTTKEVGKGTGLGLATSYAIARDRGGSIEIASELGVGTTVDVRLPRVHGREETPPRSSPPPARKHDGELSVLLVDDEPLIRRVMEQALDQHGFRVTAAGDGDAAMAALAASPFDVILLDRSMPGAPGTSLLPTLRERAPDATILYFTGQEVDPEERMLVDGVIQKPVRIGALVGAIEQAVRKRT